MKTNLFRKTHLMRLALLLLPLLGRGLGGGLLLCCPMMLFAQGNGVKVSNLAVSAGSPSTVTFTVSWSKTGMPTLWSDTVWVFVDYNNNGVMERLPVTGATLTATSALGVGKVVEDAGNNQGVWVVGNARSAGTFSATVKLVTATANVAGVCAYASNYPPVGKYTSATEISFTGTPPYVVVLKANSGGTETHTESSPYSVPTGYAVQSFTDKTGAPGSMTGGIPGIHQPQGSCTYTEPAVVGTFANFSGTYSAATYVSLIDERDNKIYPVLKMGGRWMMARSLNYQKDLVWRANSNSPSTVTGSNLALIGSFWCPGANDATTSTQAACDVYGALYSWETAMSLDGYGAWLEAGTVTYSSGAANTANAKINQGRKERGTAVMEGRGICPPNWHVPTDNEWGLFFDAVEGGNSVAHLTIGNNAWAGPNAGKYSKSACTGTATDAAALWSDNANRGTDTYGFRGLPAGNREYNGSGFVARGTWVFFWSSSASSSSYAWYREFTYDRASVRHLAFNRSIGLSVRCIRD